MYLNKYDFNGDTYVNLKELNDLIKNERKQIAQRMKRNHAEGKDEDNPGWMMAHSQLTDIARKINMSENGEKHLIFTRDNDGNWEFLVDVVRWNDLPEYMRKAAAKAKAEWVTIGTSEIDEATLYDSFEEAEAELCRVVENTDSEAWHITKKWMFDTKHGRDRLMKVFYNDDKKKTVQRPEYTIKSGNNCESTLHHDEKPKPKDEKKPKSKNELYIPARYTVWYRDDGETTAHCMGFVRFEGNNSPVFTNRPCMAFRFVHRKDAEKVAEFLGDGFDVVDMWDQMTKEERLLRAILFDDHGPNEDECEGDDE